MSHGLCIFQEGKFSGKDTVKLEAQAEMPKVRFLYALNFDSMLEEHVDEIVVSHKS